MSSYPFFFVVVLSALSIIMSTSFSVPRVDSGSVPPTNAKGRAGKGRRKIEMKRIDSDAARQVTFSKRRAGIFKKAHELCTLSGAKVAILLYSPAGNVFSFGYPCVQSTLDRFLKDEGTPQESNLPLVDAYREAKIRLLNQRYTDILAQLEEEKERAKNLQAMVDGNVMLEYDKTKNGNSLWETSMEQLNLMDLQQLKFDLGLLKYRISNQIDQMQTQVSFPSPVLAINSVGAADHSLFSQPAMHSMNQAVIGFPGFGFGFQNEFQHGPF
ncbi:hypothetical protein NE237_005223 [Protea cynaroides]|uniref:MADS-box domain-containing protein n=1 Tax=Protea cynaroides TaxID=273540 RepID=A0A9Q0KKF6_9MAGN|nr:hypothetical protein NE237_005223 [Protea cynaroides]